MPCRDVCLFVCPSVGLSHISILSRRHLYIFLTQQQIALVRAAKELMFLTLLFLNPNPGGGWRAYYRRLSHYHEFTPPGIPAIDPWQVLTRLWYMTKIQLPIMPWIYTTIYRLLEHRPSLMGPGWSSDSCLRRIYPQRRSSGRLELSQAPWFDLTLTLTLTLTYFEWLWVTNKIFKSRGFSTTAELVYY